MYEWMLYEVFRDTHTAKQNARFSDSPLTAQNRERQKRKLDKIV